MKPRYQPMRQAWPREKTIAHWRSVMDRHRAAPESYAYRTALAALDALHADSAEREPGEEG